MNVKLGIDFFEQWTDSYNWDLFCVGFYKDSHFRCINLIIFGLGVELELYNKRGFNQDEV